MEIDSHNFNFKPRLKCFCIWLWQQNRQEWPSKQKQLSTAMIFVDNSHSKISYKPNFQAWFQKDKALTVSLISLSQLNIDPSTHK